MRTELEEHLRGCEHCVITLNTTRKTIEIYRRHAIYELPNDLRERLQQAILAKCKKC
jgi:5S rRNA maturation endonuclease (ribonuclease M5)